MADDLEDLIRRAARGNLLTFQVNKEWEGPDWRATYQNSDNAEVRSVSGPDLVEVLKKALRGGMKDSPARRPSVEPAAPPKRRRGDDLI